MALIRTRAAIHTPSFNTAIFINVEVHGIAFTSLYFWIVPIVLIGSFIGVSQTESRIPRILERFHGDLHNFSADNEHRLRVEELRRLITNLHDRTFQGGIYSWQPSRWQYEAITDAEHPENQPLFDVVQERRRSAYPMIKLWLRRQFLPLIIVLIPTLAGALTSSRVPPIGWNCRVSGEVMIFFVWLGSAELDILFNYLLRSRGEQRDHLFRLTFAKDLLAAAFTIGWIMVTVIGIYNRCSCWTGRDGDLILPQRPDVNKELQHRLNVDFPAWIFSGVAMELIVVPAIVWYPHQGALKVFVQRDDGVSNIYWFWDIWDGIKRLWRRGWWDAFKGMLRRTVPRRLTRSFVMS